MKFVFRNGKEIAPKSANIEFETEQFPSETKRYALIGFSLGEARFLLDAYKSECGWMPGAVRHAPSEGRCPVCDMGLTDCSGGFCKGFERELEPFFAAMAKHPDIRIEAALRMKPLGVD